MKLDTVEIDRASVGKHNHYQPEKFFLREGPGLLVNRYRRRSMIATEDLIAGFQFALEDEVGDAAGEIMYRCGYEWGTEDIRAFEATVAEEFGRPLGELVLGMALETWWWPLQVTGWGSWEYDLSHRNEGLIFVDLYDSAIAKSIGNVGKVVCHYYAGMFAAVFGHLASRELSGIEIQCYSMGETHCRFLIGSSKRINAAQFWVREGATAAEVIARL